MDDLDLIQKINALHADIRVIDTKLEIMQSNFHEVKKKVVEIEERKRLFASRIVISLIGSLIAVSIAFIVELIKFKF